MFCGVFSYPNHPHHRCRNGQKWIPFDHFGLQQVHPRETSGFVRIVGHDSVSSVFLPLHPLFPYLSVSVPLSFRTSQNCFERHSAELPHSTGLLIWFADLVR